MIFKHFLSKQLRNVLFKKFPIPGVEPGPAGWKPAILAVRPYGIDIKMAIKIMNNSKFLWKARFVKKSLKNRGFFRIAASLPILLWWRYDLYEDSLAWMIAFCRKNAENEEFTAPKRCSKYTTFGCMVKFGFLYSVVWSLFQSSSFQFFGPLDSV